MRTLSTLLLVLLTGCFAPADLPGKTGSIEALDSGDPTDGESDSDSGGGSDDTGPGDDSGDSGTDTADPAEDLDGDGYYEDDCNDTNAAINPAATDMVGDGVDQNCDGTDGTDLDLDTYPSVISGGTDCNDDDASIYPDAEDVIGDGVDQNCSGYDRVVCYLDGDGDGYVGDTEGYYDGDCFEGGYEWTPGGDCNDADSSIYPDAPEEWDGVDSDCDGSPDYEEVLLETSSVEDEEYLTVWVRVGDPSGHSMTLIIEDGGGYTTDLPSDSSLTNPVSIAMGYQELDYPLWDIRMETTAFALRSSFGGCIVFGPSHIVSAYMADYSASCVAHTPY
jgi:hypothetical protein